MSTKWAVIGLVTLAFLFISIFIIRRSREPNNNRKSEETNNNTIVSTGACNTEATQLPEVGQLIFRSGFEIPSLVNMALEEAKDRRLRDEETGYVWSEPLLDSAGNTFIKRPSFAGLAAARQIVELVRDPDNPGNLILHTSNARGDRTPSGEHQARVALRLFPNVDNLNTRQFYARYKIKLDPALAKAQPSDHWTWFNLIEVKDDQEAVPFFFTGVSIHKERGEPMEWYIEGRQKLEEDEPFITIWEQSNPEVPVPIGRWFTAEYLFRRDADSGRIMFAITVDGTRHVVFDFDQTRPETLPANFITSLPGSESCVPLGAFEIMKTYVGPPNDLREILGEPIDAWYDDLEIWTGLPGEG